MSIEDKQPALIKGMTYSEYQKEYHKEYQRQWNKDKGGKIFRMRPTDANRLKSYYNEYCMTCQQNLTPVVTFHDFIIQFAELGFNMWRDKVKGK